jgi:hypothetical protein
MVRNKSSFRNTNLRNRRPGREEKKRGKSGQVEDKAYWIELKRLAEKQGRTVEDIQKIREDKETKKRNARLHGTNIESVGRDIATGEVTSRTDKLGTIRYLKDLKTGKVEEFDETGKLISKPSLVDEAKGVIEKERGSEADIAEGDVDVRGGVRLSEEEKSQLSEAELKELEKDEVEAGEIGKAGELTTGDIMTMSGIGGLAKGAFGKLAGSMAAKQVANAKGIKDYFNFMSKNKKEQSIKNVANKYGFPEAKVRKALESREFNKDLSKIIGDKNFIKKLGAFGKEAFKFGKVWLPALAGTDVIINWWAMDNVGDGLGFALENYKEGLTKGTLTQEEAIAILDEAEATYDMALEKVNSATYLNPLMYPARKFIRAGMETKRNIYDIKVANLGIR